MTAICNILITMIFVRSAHLIFVVRYTSFRKRTLQASNAISRALLWKHNKISFKVRSCIKRNLSTIPISLQRRSVHRQSYLATSNRTTMHSQRAAYHGSVKYARRVRLINVGVKIISRQNNSPRVRYRAAWCTKGDFSCSVLGIMRKCFHLMTRFES